MFSVASVSGEVSWKMVRRPRTDPSGVFAQVIHYVQQPLGLRELVLNLQKYRVHGRPIIANTFAVRGLNEQGIILQWTVSFPCWSLAVVADKNEACNDLKHTIVYLRLVLGDYINGTSPDQDVFILGGIDHGRRAGNKHVHYSVLIHTSIMKISKWAAAIADKTRTSWNEHRPIDILQQWVHNETWTYVLKKFAATLFSTSPY